ncbi:hypothetical protein [Streptomyces spiramenti]|uniref:Integral membrane protein n=1 Tax=Streptomyces spiramenti TaxID=2720606 RepID=A0ABX1ARJ7_9ACTN|nr:hypothetical protein [Streptomyces spiramenti]NJP68351.1 hypothetical protein [Streptomyces spiramenti]
MSRGHLPPPRGGPHEVSGPPGTEDPGVAAPPAPEPNASAVPVPAAGPVAPATTGAAAPGGPRWPRTWVELVAYLVEDSPNRAHSALKLLAGGVLALSLLVGVLVAAVRTADMAAPQLPFESGWVAPGSVGAAGVVFMAVYGAGRAVRRRRADAANEDGPSTGG